MSACLICGTAVSGHSYLCFTHGAEFDASGESKRIAESEPDKLSAELLQVAAVAMRWRCDCDEEALTWTSDPFDRESAEHAPGEFLHVWPSESQPGRWVWTSGGRGAGSGFASTRLEARAAAEREAPRPRAESRPMAPGESMSARMGDERRERMAALKRGVA